MTTKNPTKRKAPKRCTDLSKYRYDSLVRMVCIPFENIDFEPMTEEEVLGAFNMVEHGQSKAIAALSELRKQAPVDAFLTGIDRFDIKYDPKLLLWFVTIYNSRRYSPAGFLAFLCYTQWFAAGLNVKKFSASLFFNTLLVSKYLPTAEQLGLFVELVYTTYAADYCKTEGVELDQPTDIDAWFMSYVSENLKTIYDEANIDS